MLALVGLDLVDGALAALTVASVGGSGDSDGAPALQRLLLQTSYGGQSTLCAYDLDTLEPLPAEACPVLAPAPRPAGQEPSNASIELVASDGSSRIHRLRLADGPASQRQVVVDIFDAAVGSQLDPTATLSLTRSPRFAGGIVCDRTDSRADGGSPSYPLSLVMTDAPLSGGLVRAWRFYGTARQSVVFRVWRPVEQADASSQQVQSFRLVGENVVVAPEGGGEQVVSVPAEERILTEPGT